LVTYEHRHYAKDDAESHIEYESEIVARAKQRKTLVGESGERGEAATNANGEHKANVLTHPKSCSKTAKESDEQASHDVHAECSPRIRQTHQPWE